MKTLLRSLIFFLLSFTLPSAKNNKEFMDCALEAEIAIDVIKSKVKEEPLGKIIDEWQNSTEGTFLEKNYIETLVTFAYLNYPVMTKLEIANLQIKKCLKEEGLLVERMWLPDT